MLTECEGYPSRAVMAQYTTTTVCPNMANNAVRTIAPYATSSASTCGTISITTHASWAVPAGTASTNASTPSHTTSSTTTVFKLPPRWLGPNAQLLSGPCAAIYDQLPTWSV